MSPTCRSYMLSATMCYCYCMGMAIGLSCFKLWLPHASSLHLCISASLHGPIWIDILIILQPFIPHSGCCKASVGVTSRASSSCHGMSRTKHHQICKNKTRILEAAPQPYQVSPKGWYQLRFSDSDIQLYCCNFYPMHPVTDSQYSSIIFAALNLERSLPWYWYSIILNLGGLRFLRSRLNWTAWRRAWSGSSNNAESHSHTGRPTGRSMSFHVVPSSSLRSGNAWQ